MLAAQSALLAALMLPDGNTHGGGRPGTRQLEALLVSVTSLSEGVCAEVVSCFLKLFVCVCAGSSLQCGLPSSCGEWGLPSSFGVLGCEWLTSVASFDAEHGLLSAGASEIAVDA